MALTFGQLKSAFGEPLYMTGNFEEQYEYLILAEDEEGNKHYLSIYCGASGPSIGGKVNNKAACEAAQKLTEYITNQEPIDYTYKCSYMDGQMEIEMGVKDGNPFCEKN